jgi:hypothetical protein
VSLWQVPAVQGRPLVSIGMWMLEKDQAVLGSLPIIGRRAHLPTEDRLAPTPAVLRPGDGASATTRSISAPLQLPRPLARGWEPAR